MVPTNPRLSAPSAPSALLALLALLVLPLLILAGPLRAGERYAALLGELENIQNEAGTRTASIGFCLVPLDGPPDETAGYREDLGLVPASTMKVVTTATALERLGRTHRFETGLEIAGSVDEEGLLEGHVVIRGGGDPTFAASGGGTVFDAWHAALAEAGVKRVSGSVVGDGSIFDTRRVPDTWQWNDFGNYYGSGACGLNYHSNLYHATFHTPRVGGAAPFTGARPVLPGVEFVNEMRVGAAGSGDQGYIYAAPYGRLVYFRGTVPAGGGSFTIRGALPEPALSCAEAFAEHLASRGLEVEGEPTTLRLLDIAGESLPARERLHTHESEPLAEILKTTNLRSDNLRADALFRFVAAEAGEEGRLAAASRIHREHWATKGIDMAGFAMDDGSGLSRANTVTARQMALILYHAAEMVEFPVFYASLPVAGRSGTLRSIGKGSAAEGRVVAKSGTIDRVRNYAGYVNGRSGKRYAFALFFNQYSGSLSDVRAKVVRVWNRMAAL